MPEDARLEREARDASLHAREPAMNIGQIKILSWLGAVLLTSFLAFYVWTFVRGLEQIRRPPDAEKIRAALEESEPVKAKAQDLVAYADVTRLFLLNCKDCKGNPNCHHMNWTGKVAPPPVVEGDPDKPKPVLVIPVKDLVRVLMVRVDMSDPKESIVFLKYTPKSGLKNTGTPPGYSLREGDKLSPPHDKIRVESIDAAGVTFAFDEAGREKETLVPAEFELKSGIAEVGPNGVVLPPLGSTIKRGQTVTFNPPHTVAIGKDKYILGREDMQYINENYAQVINQVRWERHQDPHTGKYDGIELKEVVPGSLAAQHGAQEGDVIKSINGHPVTSVQEAITFAKNNSGKYTTWEIVVDSHGQTKTITYHSPQQ
jgi:hypothetical protein